MYVSAGRFLHSPGHDCITYAKVSGAGIIAWRTQLHLTPAEGGRGSQRNSVCYDRVFLDAIFMQIFLNVMQLHTDTRGTLLILLIHCFVV